MARSFAGLQPSRRSLIALPGVGAASPVSAPKVADSSIERLPPCEVRAKHERDREDFTLSRRSHWTRLRLVDEQNPTPLSPQKPHFREADHRLGRPPARFY